MSSEKRIRCLQWMWENRRRCWRSIQFAEMEMARDLLIDYAYIDRLINVSTVKNMRSGGCWVFIDWLFNDYVPENPDEDRLDRAIIDAEAVALALVAADRELER